MTEREREREREREGERKRERERERWRETSDLGVPVSDTYTLAYPHAGAWYTHVYRAYMYIVHVRTVYVTYMYMIHI